jgi:hypothetical protein
LAETRAAAEREQAESRAKTFRVLEEATQRAAELEAEWHTEVGNRRQALDGELAEKRQQAEAELNEMTERAEKVRADTEVHQGRIIEGARGEVEASGDRIATETAQAIEHVRIEIENMRTAARAEAEKTREAAETQALKIVRDAEERAAQLYRAAQAGAEALVERAQRDADQTRGKATVHYLAGWLSDEPGEKRPESAESSSSASSDDIEQLETALARLREVLGAPTTAHTEALEQREQSNVEAEGTEEDEEEDISGLFRRWG